MTLTMRLLFALTLLAATTLHAQPAPGTTRWADSLAVLIDHATLRGEVDAFDAALALADRVLAIAPTDGAILHYKGYALYRKATLLANAVNRPEDAKRVLEEASDVLEQSAKHLPWPETPAVHASVLGQQIAQGGMLAGMRLGGRADDLFAAAIRLGPDNPRVLMLRGISSLFKPRMFGGGADKAVADLIRATELFGREHPAPGLPRWGHAEGWAWLGQAHAAEKDVGAARAAYQKALSLVPEYGWVKYQLLPELDKVKP